MTQWFTHVETLNSRLVVGSEDDDDLPGRLLPARPLFHLPIAIPQDERGRIARAERAVLVLRTKAKTRIFVYNYSSSTCVAIEVGTLARAGQLELRSRRGGSRVTHGT